MKTAVTILICTRNRAKSLAETLESVLRCRVPQGWEAELVVVDNGSTDATREVVDRTAGAAKGRIGVMSVFEGRAGKGYAYNTGIAAASGGYLLLTDDDVRVPGDWMEGMIAPLVADEADAVAGAVKIPESYVLPSGLHKGWVASTEWLDFKSPTTVVGANCAFARRVLERVPGFDTRLGPGGLGFHDETLFAAQLLKAGYRLAGRADVAVEHWFDASRLTRRGVLSMAEKMGRSWAYYDYHWKHDEPTFGPGYRRRVWAGLQARRVLGAKACLGGKICQWELDRVQQLGYMDQLEMEKGRPRNYEKFGLRKLTEQRLEPVAA